MRPAFDTRGFQMKGMKRRNMTVYIDAYAAMGECSETSEDEMESLPWIGACEGARTRIREQRLL